MTDMNTALPSGWTESRSGGMATNPDPVHGGIIDAAIVSGEWFAVFNDERLPTLEGFSTRAAAFDAFSRAVLPCAASPKG